MPQKQGRRFRHHHLAQQYIILPDLLMLGAFLTASTNGLTLQARDEPTVDEPATIDNLNTASINQLNTDTTTKGNNGFKFCYAVQVRLTTDPSLNKSKDEKTKYIKEAFSIPDPKNKESKECGKEKIKVGDNPAPGSVLKAFKVKPASTGFECFGKDKKGRCGVAAALTLSAKDAKDCGSCGKLD